MLSLMTTTQQRREKPFAGADFTADLTALVLRRIRAQWAKRRS